MTSQNTPNSSYIAPVKVAIIGSGVAGLSAAWHLIEQNFVPVQVTLFEKDQRLGGHTNTVDVHLEGKVVPVDTGFLVCNERTYPLFIPFLEKIGVPLVPTDMSFAVSVGPHQFEWCGSDLRSLFAQPSNLFSLRFWKMLKDVLRFNKAATAIAAQAETAEPEVGISGAIPLGAYLADNGYSAAFRDDYLIPMAAAIWSCPTKTMLTFPVASFARFFHNHGLLQITNRPRWFTVPNGAKQYVDKIALAIKASSGTVHLNCGVLEVKRGGQHATVVTAHGETIFDHVVMACHSNQTLAMIADLSNDEKSLLQAIPYQANTAYLHTDDALMPKRRNAWAAWNYLSEKRGSQQEQSVSVTYWMNRLQPLPISTQVFVSLNPITAPRADKVIQKIAYSHPVFELGSTQAQASLPKLQGIRNTWYAGAWTGYGFHEDGFRSGRLAADALIAQISAQRIHHG